MEFFNKKEDVIEIKLTQYGKHLLSKGKFKPYFYAFFDDNILYDQQFAGRDDVEPQNAIEPRIQEETPSFKTQYVYSGIETEIVKLNKLVRSGQAALGDEALQPSGEKHFALRNALGRSEIGNDKLPGIGIRYLHNEITGAANHMTGSFTTMQIPQLESHIIYETEIQFEGEANDVIDSEGAAMSFDDGSFITIRDDYILLEMKEANNDNFLENFDIEFYMVEYEDVSGSVVTPSLSATSKYKKEKWVPMYFHKKPVEVENNLLLDQNLSVERNPPSYTPEFVEYFFNVFVDWEIDRDLLCGALSVLKSDDYFGDSPYECPEPNESAFVSSISPYTTTTSEPTDCDD